MKEIVGYQSIPDCGTIITCSIFVAEQGAEWCVLSKLSGTSRYPTAAPSSPARYLWRSKVPNGVSYPSCRVPVDTRLRHHHHLLDICGGARCRMVPCPGGGIRTPEGVHQQIYSLPPLATWVPLVLRYTLYHGNAMRRRI